MPVTRIRATREFTDWIDGLKDRNARARNQARIERLATGNPGDHRNLKRGIGELRIDVGPGYRVYYMRQRELLIILLCGGDKSSQRADIRAAYRMAAELEA